MPLHLQSSGVNDESFLVSTRRATVARTGEGNQLKRAEAKTVLSAGKKLRELREQMGLTLRDVEISSTSLSESRGIEEFIINRSRLSDI